MLHFLKARGSRISNMTFWPVKQSTFRWSSRPDRWSHNFSFYFPLADLSRICALVRTTQNLCLSLSLSRSGPNIWDWSKLSKRFTAATGLYSFQTLLPFTFYIHVPITPVHKRWGECVVRFSGRAGRSVLAQPCLHHPPSTASLRSSPAPVSSVFTRPINPHKGQGSRSW